MVDLAVTPEIAAVVRQIVEQFHPQRIILYGSRAYGIPTPESDFDLMVVMTPEGSPSEQAWRIQQALAEPSNVRLDLHVLSPAQIRRGVREHDFFIRDVMRGITLYEGEGMGTSEEEQAEEEEPGARQRLKHATQGWLRRAREDADVAVRLLGDQFPYTNVICFHAQQSIEKSLKGLLQEREVEFPRTHNLVELAELAAPVVPDLSAHKAALEKLNKCAVEARYPELTISMPDAQAAVQEMTVVRELILAALGVAATGNGQGGGESGR